MPQKKIDQLRADAADAFAKLEAAKEAERTAVAGRADAADNRIGASGFSPVARPQDIARIRELDAEIAVCKAYDARREAEALYDLALHAVEVAEGNADAIMIDPAALIASIEDLVAAKKRAEEARTAAVNAIPRFIAAARVTADRLNAARRTSGQPEFRTPLATGVELSKVNDLLDALRDTTPIKAKSTERIEQLSRERNAILLGIDAREQKAAEAARVEQSRRDRARHDRETAAQSDARATEEALQRGRDAARERNARAEALHSSFEDRS